MVMVYGRVTRPLKLPHHPLVGQLINYTIADLKGYRKRKTNKNFWKNGDTVDDEMFSVFFVMFRKITSVVLSRWRFENDDTSLIYSADVDVFGPATESLATIFNHRSETDDPFRFIPARVR